MVKAESTLKRASGGGGGMGVSYRSHPELSSEILKLRRERDELQEAVKDFEAQLIQVYNVHVV